MYHEVGRLTEHLCAPLSDALERGVDVGEPGPEGQLREGHQAAGPGGEGPAAPAAQPPLRAVGVAPSPHDVRAPAPRAGSRVALLPADQRLPDPLRELAPALLGQRERRLQHAVVHPGPPPSAVTVECSLAGRCELYIRSGLTEVSRFVTFASEQSLWSSKSSRFVTFASERSRRSWRQSANASRRRGLESGLDRAGAGMVRQDRGSSLGATAHRAGAYRHSRLSVPRDPRPAEP